MNRYTADGVSVTEDLTCKFAVCKCAGPLKTCEIKVCVDLIISVCIGILSEIVGRVDLVDLALLPSGIKLDLRSKRRCSRLIPLTGKADLTVNVVYKMAQGASTASSTIGGASQRL